MKLSSSQRRRFFRLYDALVAFAAPRIDELGGEPGVDDTEDALAPIDFTRRLWTSPGIIDAFIEENPADLSPRDLAAVAQWKSALFGIFHIVLLPGHESVFLLDGHVFSVRGLDVQLDEMLVRNDQAIVFTTLLPFEEAIVFGGELYPTGLPVTPAMRHEMREEVLRRKAQGDVLTTAKELMAASKAVGLERREVAGAA